MGSQLDMHTAWVTPDVDDYACSAINADPAPSYYIPNDPRPSKRLRLATRTLNSLATRLSPSSHRLAIKPAHHSVHEHVSPEQVPPRSASVPPEQPKRGRKKKTSLLARSDPFVHEHMPFPEHQPWLKVKPRQRKAAVEVAEETPVPPPASQAPTEGEDLVLDKHADRIAALIAQKRRDNDSKQFRQRMALQQRLHRGEKDGQDKRIAASHDELKRKMELSAQGIFEENPPNGIELEFRLSERQLVVQAEEALVREPTVPLDYRRHTIHAADMGLAEGPNVSLSDQSAEVSDSSDFDEAFEDAEFVGATYAHFDNPQPILGAYVHHNRTAYVRQSEWVNRAASKPVTIPIPRTDSGIYATVNYDTHYARETQNWRSMQQWTTQMFQALPSTQTPELERAKMASRRLHAGPYDALHDTYSHTSDNYDFYGSAPHSVTNTSSSSSTPAAEITHMHRHPHLSQAGPSSSNLENNDETDPSALKSNVNIFTRQARENGVIGGNNNVNPSTASRRNMFDSRT